mgnify:CR=1 FL=1
MFKYDLLVYIGRFQPFHLGHESVVRQALTLAHKVLIIIGSADSPRTIKNPFTFTERLNMISTVLADHIGGRVDVSISRDYPYDEEKWFDGISRAINHVGFNMQSIGKYGFIGHKKDSSSYYLENIDIVEASPFKVAKQVLDASKIRELMFARETSFYGAFEIASLRKPVLEFIEHFRATSDFVELQKEFKILTDYKKQFSGLKYPIQFITVDVVVQQKDFVLLIKRRGYPGKGLWALPGGFKDHKETCKQSAIRELAEETGLSHKEISAQIESQHPVIFDHPDRSLRGTTVTMAYHVKLKDNALYQIKAGDDADVARWFNLASIQDMRKNMFEDHWHIINHFVKMEKNDD